MTNLKEGDIIKNDNYERTVLAVIGGTGETRCYVMSIDRAPKEAGSIWTAYDLKKEGYIVKGAVCETCGK